MMKLLSNTRFVVAISLALVILYSLAAHITFVNAVFLAVFVLIAYYLGVYLRINGKNNNKRD